MKRTVQRGAVASFTIGDVVSPDAVAVTRQTGPELAVSGRIVYLSDSGSLKDHFAVVDVDGIHTPLVVPVDRLHVEEVAEADGALRLRNGRTWRIHNDAGASPESAPR